MFDDKFPLFRSEWGSTLYQIVVVVVIIKY